MRTAKKARIPPRSDLTARARIRDAAVLRFATDGFDVGLRAIAADASVTPGLITHHFGSKERLRAECDEHVLAAINEMKKQSAGTEAAEDALSKLMSVEQYAPLTGYVVRSFQAGGELAVKFFDQLVSDGLVRLERGVKDGSIKPSRDPQARARHLTMQGVGALLVQAALSTPRTASELASMLREQADATTLPALELFTEGLLTDHTVLDAYLTYSNTSASNTPASNTPDKTRTTDSKK